MNLNEIITKIMARLTSSRVWAVAVGNVIGIEAVKDGWPRAMCVAVINAAYILSELWIKTHSAKPDPHVVQEGE